jgi:hypothetical protein
MQTAAVTEDEDTQMARLFAFVMDDPLPTPQSGINETLRHDHEHYYHDDNINNDMHSASIVSNIEQLEIMGLLDMFDTLLADSYLPERELNDILRQQAECIQRLELLQQRGSSEHDEDFFDVHEDEAHQYYNEQGTDDSFHDEVFEAQQLEEQIREIEEFEAARQENERLSAEMVHMLTARNPPRVAPPKNVHRPSNRSRSFKGFILNPNQEETTEDSSHTQSETQLVSPGSSTTILSADFGDDDVLPIEEKSCVICCLDYQHGDEIVRNAHGCGSNIRGRNSNMIPETCNHVFHTKCITSWVERSGKSDCPCCRRPFAIAAPT